MAPEFSELLLLDSGVILFAWRRIEASAMAGGRVRFEFLLNNLDLRALHEVGEWHECVENGFVV